MTSFPTHSDRITQWLTQGGDARILSDLQSGLNRYGYPALAQPHSTFGSCTASPISPAAFAALEQLHQRLGPGLESRNTGELEAEFERLRAELSIRFGMAGLPESSLIFAASGTDLHLIAAQLAASEDPETVLSAVMLASSETGQGVPNALRARHSSECAPFQGSVKLASPLPGAQEFEILEFPGRNPDGSLLPAETVDAQVESTVREARARGRRILLILSDVSKTGLRVPSAACAKRLLETNVDTLEVLVDACQGRLGPASLRRYLELGFAVAITGSKFMTGPAFSGALLLPAGLSQRWQRRPLPASLAAYSARADWPQGWMAREQMGEAVNLGLLLRWEAALIELRAFQELDPTKIKNFLKSFSKAVRERLLGDSSFEALESPELDPDGNANDSSWDSVTTIFPFLLRREKFLSSAQTGEVYKALLAQKRGMGQAVDCGRRDGQALQALRICSSMRLAVEALGPGGRGEGRVIQEALELLDATAKLF